MVQDWRAPSGHPAALAQGVWIGAALSIATIVGELGGEAVLVLLMAPVMALAVLGIPAAVLDILALPHRTHRAITWILLGAVVLTLLYWVSPTVPDLPHLSGDAGDMLWPAVGLAYLTERLAARRWLAWRDRGLGALAGFLVCNAFTFGEFYIPLAWALLLGALALPLPKDARIALAVLAGLPALGLRGFVDHVWLGRALEWAAWLGYGAASFAVFRRHRPGLLAGSVQGKPEPAQS